MNPDQWTYRQLYFQILEYTGDALYADVVGPWIRGADEERRWLDSLRGRRGDPIPVPEETERARLYAFSRVIDLLQLGFAPPVETPPEDSRTWSVAPLALSEFEAAMEGMGLQKIDRAGFHPFHHEIVRVDQHPEASAPPAVAEVYWPGYRLGPLLISRAGVRVRAGRDHVVKEIAETSTLYWAWARNHRRTRDLSQGWGSNSQWRTDFRRDYALDGRFWYNVDAKQKWEDWMFPDRATLPELVRHRCRMTFEADDRAIDPYWVGWTEDAR